MVERGDQWGFGSMVKAGWVRGREIGMRDNGFARRQIDWMLRFPEAGRKLLPDLVVNRGLPSRCCNGCCGRAARSS